MNTSSFELIKRVRVNRVPPPCRSGGPRQSALRFRGTSSSAFTAPISCSRSSLLRSGIQRAASTETRELVTTSPSGSSGHALAVSSDVIKYLFVVPEYTTDFGQELKVVGSLPQLGNWNAHAAPSMSWCSGHRWRLDVTLPKTAFEFKVVMMHGNQVRWEQGINRGIQADANSHTQLQGANPVEVIIKVNCFFNHPDDTQLAVMVPLERMREAFEVAQAALEMLQQRKKKLQREMEKTQTASNRTQEMNAMTEAEAGQTSSVAKMAELLEQSKQDPEGCVSLPIARISIPAGASLSMLPKLTAASFLPPEQAVAALRSLPPAAEQLSALSHAPCPPGQAAKAGPAVSMDATSSSSHSPSASRDGAVRSPRSEASSAPDSNIPLGASTPPSAVTPEAQARQESQAKAAQELDSVCQRLQDFFQRHPAPTGSSPAVGGGSAAATDGLLDGAAQDEVRELAALMSEAEDAWQVARSLSSFEEDEEDEDELMYRFDQRGLQEELGEAAAIQSFARDQLALRLASAAGSKAGDAGFHPSSASASDSGGSAARSSPAEASLLSSQVADRPAAPAPGQIKEAAAGAADQPKEVSPEHVEGARMARPEGPAAAAAAAGAEAEGQVEGARTAGPEGPGAAAGAEQVERHDQQQELLVGARVPGEARGDVAAMGKKPEAEQADSGAATTEEEAQAVPAGEGERPTPAVTSAEAARVPTAVAAGEAEEMADVRVPEVEEQAAEAEAEPVVVAEQQVEEQQVEKPALAPANDSEAAAFFADEPAPGEGVGASHAAGAMGEASSSLAAQAVEPAAGEKEEQAVEGRAGAAEADDGQQQAVQQLGAATQAGRQAAADSEAAAPAGCSAAQQDADAAELKQRAADPAVAAQAAAAAHKDAPAEHAGQVAVMEASQEEAPSVQAVQQVAAGTGDVEQQGVAEVVAKLEAEQEQEAKEQALDVEAKRQLEAKEQALDVEAERQLEAKKQASDVEAEQQLVAALEAKDQDFDAIESAQSTGAAVEEADKVLAVAASGSAQGPSSAQLATEATQLEQQQQQQGPNSSQEPELILLLSATPDVNGDRHDEPEARGAFSGGVLAAPSSLQPQPADNQAEVPSYQRSAQGSSVVTQDPPRQEPEGSDLAEEPPYAAAALPEEVQRESQAAVAAQTPLVAQVQQQQQQQQRAAEPQQGDRPQPARKVREINPFQRFWNFFKP